VLIGPHDPAAMKRQVRECKQWGLNLIYDIGQQVASLPKEDLLEGLDAARMLILNQYELELFEEKTGLNLDTIRQQVSFLIITKGKDGSLVSGREVLEPIAVGVAKPEIELDPTGAGDAYRGGFLHGFIRNWPMLECARVGAVMGSFALEETGTQNHHPTVEQIHARYQQTFDQPFPNYERSAA
jgi:adenosine kinase